MFFTLDSRALSTLNGANSISEIGNTDRSKVAEFDLVLLFLQSSAPNDGQVRYPKGSAEPVQGVGSYDRTERANTLGE